MSAYIDSENYLIFYEEKYSIVEKKKQLIYRSNFYY